MGEEKVSAYERARLDNIARNQDVLRQLGLLDEKVKPAAPKARPKSNAADVASEPSRRSDRVSKKPALFEGLTDEYFRVEERDEDGPRLSTRPQREKHARTRSYAEEFHLETSPKRRAPQSARAVTGAVTGGVTGGVMTVHYPRVASDMPNGGQFMQPTRYPARGGGTSRSAKAPCPLCGEEKLVLAQDRATGYYFMQKHECVGGVVRERVRIA